MKVEIFLEGNWHVTLWNLQEILIDKVISQAKTYSRSHGSLKEKNEVRKMLLLRYMKEKFAPRRPRKF